MTGRCRRAPERLGSASARGQVDEGHGLVARGAQPAGTYPPAERVAFVAAASAQVTLGARRALINGGRCRRPPLGLGLGRLGPPAIGGLAVGVGAVAAPAPCREGDAAVQATHHNAIVTDGPSGIGAVGGSGARRAACCVGGWSPGGPMAGPKCRNAVVTGGFMAGVRWLGSSPPGGREEQREQRSAVVNESSKVTGSHVGRAAVIYLLTEPEPD
jgi:hypothetical protein